jgi:chemotaxis protein CheD
LETDYAGSGQSKYVDIAIRLMAEELGQQGADPQNLVAKIAGGANMFESEHLTLMSSIGVRNAKAAREALAKIGIPLIAEEVGGNRGRTVEFDLATGDLIVYCARDNRTSTL